METKEEINGVAGNFVLSRFYMVPIYIVKQKPDMPIGGRIGC